MERWVYLMRIILVCSVWTSCSSNNPCPTESGCFCFEGYVQCSGSSSYPSFFPNGTTHVSLFSMNADEIPKGSMDNIPYLESYELYQSRIKVIKRGAFSNMKIKTFSIYNVDVGEIEGFAFNNLSNIESFSIYGMTIKTIHSYAFSNIYKVQTWGMSSVDLTTVETYSFYNFSVQSFQLFNSVVGDMKRGAITHVDKINDYELHSNEFGVLECGTVEPLLRLANVSSFYDNVFQCDCKLAWMLNDERVRGFLFANSCEMPNTKDKISLEKLDIDQLACDWTDDGCDVSLVTSAGLMTTSTDPSTENSVNNDKTTYFSEGAVKTNIKYEDRTTKTVSMETETVSIAATAPGGRKSTDSVTKNSQATLIDTISSGNGQNTSYIVKDSGKTLKPDTSTHQIKTTNKITEQTLKVTNRPKQVNMNTKDNGSVKVMANVYMLVMILSYLSFVL